MYTFADKVELFINVAFILLVTSLIVIAKWREGNDKGNSK